MPAHLGYERIQDLNVQSADTDAASANPVSRLYAWWEQLQFWTQVTIGGECWSLVAPASLCTLCSNGKLRWRWELARGILSCEYLSFAPVHTMLAIVTTSLFAQCSCSGAISQHS